MDGFTYFDGLLLGVAAIAVTWKLAALMRARRELVVKQVQDQLAEQAELRRLEEKRRMKEEAAAKPRSA